MNRLDENKMWEIIDLVISKEVKENEAIKSMGHNFVELRYFAIVSNKLLQSEVTLDMSTLCLMQTPGLQAFIKDLIEQLRQSSGEP